MAPSSRTTESPVPGLLFFGVPWSELKVCLVCAFYLSLNFVLFALPFALYGAISVESRVCQLFWVVVLLDYAVPLRTPCVWPAWCHFFDDIEGKRTYFSAEVIDEFTCAETAALLELGTTSGASTSSRTTTASASERKGTSSSTEQKMAVETGVVNEDDAPSLDLIQERIRCAIQSKGAAPNFLAVYHPHALFGIGHSLMAKEMYEKYGVFPLFAGADVLTKLPLLRRFLAWFGFTKVSASELRRNLQRPFPENFLTLLPGGITEMFYGTEGEEQIVLRKRQGFCKVALQTNAFLVPVYCMGANQIFDRKFTHRSFFARVSSKLKTSLVYWTDRFGIPFGPIPYRRKLVVCIGKPIAPVVRHDGQHARSPGEDLPNDGCKAQQENYDFTSRPQEQQHGETPGMESHNIGTEGFYPTAAQVEDLHTRYVAALRDLFDRHKERAGWAAHKELYLENESLPTMNSRCKGVKQQ
ncbi:unnamed protein product [Amoebophrya sp. A120]|nr:unnamed protein product [Amoebophrya sp. A120]|eukprot:GSA120T00017947001.1